MKETQTEFGKFIYKKLESPTEFICQRCNFVKKSKTVITWQTIEGETKTICNGCYGLLLSKNK
jgi:hypothetical protein